MKSTLSNVVSLVSANGALNPSFSFSSPSSFGDPDRPFPQLSEPQNPSMDVSVLHIIGVSRGSENMEFRSGFSECIDWLTLSVEKRQTFYLLLLLLLFSLFSSACISDSTFLTKT